ncbi:MAG: hypothetical protein DMF79_16115 [Acidobacteria bacterium]|nr:MAG: hypothetical protein DMF79_16115 [Acidobacteriota bacterium]
MTVRPVRTPFLDLRPADGWARVAVRDDLGILAGLARRGYPSVSLRTSGDGDEHRLRVLAPGFAAPLLNLRLAELSTFFREPPRLRLGLEVLSVLAVHGLVLRDPRAEFSPDRPRLPGQERPGLGVFATVLERLRLWAEDWGKDGLLAFPPHFHAAVLLGRWLRFVSPARQGRFEALRRDLAALSLAESSWAVEEGRVKDEAGTAVRWLPAEMVAPLTPDLRGYVESEAYVRAAAEARDSVRFRIA